MTFEDLLKQLSVGELSNMYMGLDGEGSIAENQLAKIVIHTNTALTLLHTKLLIKTRDVLVELQAGISYYHLKSIYAQSSFDPAKAAVPYILDLGNEPFSDDVLQILYVFDAHGKEIPFNDPTKSNSIYAPQPAILHVPDVEPGNVLCIGYRAAPNKVTGAFDQEIEIPVTLVQALTAYIAYLIYNNLNTPEGMAIAQGHLQMFTNQCDMAEYSGTLDNSTPVYAHRFHANSWV